MKSKCTPRAAALALAALLPSACSQPVYTDAAVPPACAEDARCRSGELEADGAALDARVETPADAGLEAMPSDPVAPLLGRYAVHARFYGRDLTSGLVRVLHELVVLADITREASGLKMRVETCLDRGRLVTEFGPGTDVSVKLPARFPVRVFDLNHANGTFHSSGEPLAIGYRADPPGCTPGVRVAATESWRSGGTCLCPSDPLSPPVSSDDCRVIDSDLDGQPGMTVASKGLITGEQQVCIRDRSRYVEGVVVPDSRRHRAKFIKDEDFLQLSCSGADCQIYGFRLCALEQQPAVSFVPLDGMANVTCDELVRRQDNGQLFSGEQLDSFPSGC